MSNVRRDIARRKLSELLTFAEQEEFFLMTWAIDAIQSGRESYAKQFFQYPAEAVTRDAGSPYTVHKWRLESLINEILLRGGSHIYREIGERFESYCFELSKCMLPVFHVVPNVEYKLRGKPVHSPDILVSDGGKVVAAIECKAKKMTFEAKFADDPIVEAKAGYLEIAKGIFQLWRFFSHCRQSVTGLQLATNVVGIIVTLDNWLEMSNELRELVTGMANDMADGDIAIQASDRTTIAFCSIGELEVTLQHASPQEFINAVRESISPRFFGWNLSGVHRQLTNGLNRNNQFPFDDRLVELNPAWQN